MMALMFVANNVFAASYTADDFVITVKTDNPGISDDGKFIVPTFGSGYHYSVDCSYNGTDVIYDTTNHSGDYTCDYGPHSGIYTIVIHGTFPQIYFDDSGDKDKLIEINQWGTGQWRSMAHAFEGCSNLVVNATDTPDLSGVTTLLDMFMGASSLGGGIGNWDWDTSNITIMEGVFSEAVQFNKDISVWDVHDVTDMFDMFFDARMFNQDIGDWNTGNVVYMSYMFNEAHSFNQDIGDWDTRNVMEMDNMFEWATSFDQNIGSWNVVKVGDMEEMFLGVTLSTSNYDALLNGWSTQTLQNNVSFDAGNSRYCNAKSARANMVANYTWNISDRGIDDSCAKTPIYRLYNKKTGTQLYTKGDADKDKILNKYKDFEFTDGAPAFYASTSNDGNTPMYRLYNKKTGAQLYTKGEADRDKILNKWSDFEFTDGSPAFYAAMTPGIGLTPIFRLYNTKTGMHLYTKGVADREKILNKYSDFEFTDGAPAFYASLTQ